MMTIRSISHVLTVATFVLASNSCFANVLVNAINNNKATGAAVVLSTALSEDADAAKAALETMGVVADVMLNGEKVHPLLIPVNFSANLGVRKAVRCVDANGIKAPNPDLGKILNAHGVNSAKETFKAVLPQAIAVAAVYFLVK